MPVNTITVATAVTPTVIHTYISHYLNRRSLRQKPTAHISYHEGLELIRRFLYYASFHTVDEVQAFTSQWVPVPHWVHVEEADISSTQLEKSAAYIQAQLGPEGIEQVGGKTWWQWRRDSGALRAEWIEMRKDQEERKRIGGIKGRRIMLYVHGGAYYFGSVDEHRYQMQRHARKLKARVIAPRYRLAPQFPFPCGLHDCECHISPSFFELQNIC
jgi:acetyl esterase/lipase